MSLPTPLRHGVAGQTYAFGRRYLEDWRQPEDCEDVAEDPPRNPTPTRIGVPDPSRALSRSSSPDLRAAAARGRPDRCRGSAAPLSWPRPSSPACSDAAGPSLVSSV